MQYVYGKHVVKDLLEANKTIHNAYILDGLKDKELIASLKKEQVNVVMCGKKKLDQLTGGKNHQGIVCEIDDYKLYTLEELRTLGSKGEHPLYIMLDGIEDPHNLGAILRSSDAVNADAVLIGKHGSVGLTPTVAKVSTGAIDHVPVCEVTNLSRTLQQLKEEGFWVVGTALDEKAQDYRTVDYGSPIVLVIGNEGEGISPLVLKQCDFKVYLPMDGHVQSLNASVATGILLYEIRNQRNK